MIPTHGGYHSAENVPGLNAQCVDMSGLIRQMNASNRKLTRAVKVRTRAMQRQCFLAPDMHNCNETVQKNNFMFCRRKLSLLKR